jgi:serine/threonine protein kinase
MDGGEIGHFSLLEKIGEGGMGRVYKARDLRLDRLVAIKVLPEARQGDADRRARFVQEAKAASALNHPNIITIHEIGEQDGRTFIVMELVDGKPLNELILRKGMRLTEALRIAAQVADALTAAHAAGIVHRDLKPANIMVDSHGRVRVLDFGLAKLIASVTADGVGADEATRTVTVDQPVTEEGVIVGSVPYMSPEQAEGRVVDPRSDIFSFGAVLYEMVTGQRAFRGESRISTLAAIVEKEPQPPSAISSTTPPELDRLILRCLRKDINRRSQTMADLKLALEELRDESESGKLPRPAVDASVRRRLWRWPALAIASLLIAAVAVVSVYLNHRGTQPKGPNLVRLSPDDGYSYGQPAISPDGGFVAYISDRSGDDQLWLQQVGGGDPIQLTHSTESVSFPSFFPDGRRILYISSSTSGTSTRSSIEVISALGGDPLTRWTSLFWHESSIEHCRGGMGQEDPR